MPLTKVPELKVDLQTTRVLTVNEARAVLRCGEFTVRKLVKAGAFGPPESIMFGHVYRIPTSAVLRYAEGERGGMGR